MSEFQAHGKFSVSLNENIPLGLDIAGCHSRRWYCPLDECIFKRASLGTVYRRSGEYRSNSNTPALWEAPAENFCERSRVSTSPSPSLLPLEHEDIIDRSRVSRLYRMHVNSPDFFIRQFFCFFFFFPYETAILFSPITFISNPTFASSSRGTIHLILLDPRSNCVFCR